MQPNFKKVTEIAGDEVSQEQVDRLFNRYSWAAEHCIGKDVLEAACGSGQSLGYLNRLSKTFEAGDFSDYLLSTARQHYGNRIKLYQFDACNMPFAGRSKDIIILFEAIYYLPDAELFVQECKRVLRPHGKVLIVTANKDLFDFNPSPHSNQYYGVVELKNLFSKFGFKTEFFGDTPVDKISLRQKLLRPVKKIVISLGLMPKSMAGKKLLKILVFGNLVAMPGEIDENTSEYVEPNPISSDSPDTKHKVIYCTATLNSIE
jgi:SAM-dependent methyltransferase